MPAGVMVAGSVALPDLVDAAAPEACGPGPNWRTARLGSQSFPGASGSRFELAEQETFPPASCSRGKTP